MSQVLLQNVHRHSDAAMISGVRSSFLTDEEIRAMSVLSVTYPPGLDEKSFAESPLGSDYRLYQQVPMTSDTHKPMRIQDQLNHNITGSTDFRTPCIKCKGNNGTCLGHPFLHHFPWFVCHTGFLPRVCRDLRLFCYFCSRFVRGDILDDLDVPSPDIQGDEMECLAWRKPQAKLFNAIAPHTTTGTSSGVHNNAAEAAGEATLSAATQQQSTEGGNATTPAAATKQVPAAEYCHHCHMPQPKYVLENEVIHIKWHLPADKNTTTILLDAHPQGWQPTRAWLVQWWHTLLRSIHARNAYEFLGWRTEHPQWAACLNGTCNEEHVVDVTMGEGVVSSQEQHDWCHRMMDDDTSARRLLVYLTSTRFIPNDGTESDDERWLLRTIAFLSPHLRSIAMTQAFTCADAFLIFDRVRNDDVWRMGLDPRYDHPRFMLQRSMMVLPKTHHPNVSESSGAETQRTDPLTRRYANVIKYSRVVKFHCTQALAETRHHHPHLFAGNTIALNGETPLWSFYGVRRLWMCCRPELWQSIANVAFEYACLVDHSVGEKKANSTKKKQNSGKMGAKNAKASRQKTTHDNITTVTDASMLRTAVAMAQQQQQQQQQQMLRSTSTNATTNPSSRCHHHPFTWFLRFLNAAWTTDSLRPEYWHDETSQQHRLNNATTTIRKPALWPSYNQHSRATSTASSPPPPPPLIIDASPTLPPSLSSKYDMAPQSKSLSGSQGKKAGNVRRNLKGKRHANSKRGVLKADGTLPIDEIGLSEAACLTQTIPIRVTRANMASLKRRVANGAGVLEGAAFIVTDEPAIIHLPIRKLKEKIRVQSKCDLARNAHGCIGQTNTEFLFNLNQQSTDATSAVTAQYAQKQSMERSELSSHGNINNVKDAESRLRCKYQHATTLAPFLKVGWVVHVYLNDGDMVVMNRQPTLHRPSHNLHRVRVIRGKCISMSESVMSGYNADTDGDCMVATVPQSLQARADNKYLMSVYNNIMCSRTHRPAVSPGQDALNGAYLLTHKDTFLNRDHAMRILSAAHKVSASRLRKMTYVGFMSTFVPSAVMDDDESGVNDGSALRLPLPAILKPEMLWTGKQLFQSILPHDLTFIKDTSERHYERWSYATPKNAEESTARHDGDAVWSHVMKQKDLVVFDKGYWICGDGNNALFGKTHVSIIQHLWRRYGKRYVTDVMSDWNHMAHTYIGIRGFTCGITDMMLGGVPNVDTYRKWREEQRDMFASYYQHSSGGDLSKSDKTSQLLPVPMAIRFRRDAEAKKMRIFGHLDRAFIVVLDFFKRPDVLRLLTFDDLHRAHGVLQSWAQDMVKYCNNMLNAFTEATHNNIMIMCASGAKGSIVNASTMGMSTGLESIQDVPVGMHEGRYGPALRENTTRRLGEFTPGSIGFSKNGFVSGMDQREIIHHSEPARENMRVSSNPTQSGYLQRRTSKNCESSSIHYDGTVRNGPNEILELLYGGDGFAADKVEWVMMTPAHLHIHRYCHMDDVKISNVWRNVLDSCLSTPRTLTHTSEEAFLESQLRIIGARGWPLWFGNTSSCRHTYDGDDGCDSCAAEAAAHEALVHDVLSDKVHRVAYDMQSFDQLRSRGVRLLLNMNVGHMRQTHASSWWSRFQHATLPVWVRVARAALKQCGCTRQEQWRVVFGEIHPRRFLNGIANESNGMSARFWRLVLSNKELVPHLPLAHHADYWDGLSHIMQSIQAFSGANGVVHETLLSVISNLRFTHLNCGSNDDDTHLRSMLTTPDTPSIGLHLCLATPAEIRQLFSDVYETFCEGFAPPGEAVGNNATQCMTAGATQATMNAFKTTTGAVNDNNAAASIKQYIHLSTGLPRTDDVMNNTVPSASSVTCILSPHWVRSRAQASIVSWQLVEMTLRQICANHYVLWMDLNADVRWLRRAVHIRPEVKTTAQQEVTPHHALYSELRTLFVASNRTNNRTALPPPRQGFVLFHLDASATTKREAILSTSADDKHASTTSSVNLCDTWKHMLECHLNASLLPWQRGALVGGPSVHAKCPYYWCLWSIHAANDPLFASSSNASRIIDNTWLQYLQQLKVMADGLVDKWRVMGVPDVEACLAITPPEVDVSNLDFTSSHITISPSHCWTLHLKSNEFKRVLTHPAVLDTYCRTSNWHAIRDTIHLEASAQQMGYETSMVLSNTLGDIYVQPRHLQLIIDNMTSQGKITAINRHGMAKRDSPFLDRVGFEETASNLFESAMHGMFDPVQHATSNIMLGNRLPYVGTGICETSPFEEENDGDGVGVMDFNLVEANDEEVDALMYVRDLVSIAT